MSLTLALMGAQFAYSGVKSLMGHSQRQSQYRAQKKQAKKQAAARNAELHAGWMRDLERISADNQAAYDAFNATINQSHQQIAYNNEYLTDMFQQRQFELNQAFAQQAFQDQQDTVQLLKKSGMMAAAGQSGVTAQRLDSVQPMAQLGQRRAVYNRNMIGRVDAFEKGNEMLDKRIANQNMNLAMKTSILPRLGRIPSAPSRISAAYVQDPGSQQMWMELGGAGLQAGMGIAGHLTAQNRHNEMLKALSNRPA